MVVVAVGLLPSSLQIWGFVWPLFHHWGHRRRCLRAVGLDSCLSAPRCFVLSQGTVDLPYASSLALSLLWAERPSGTRADRAGSVPSCQDKWPQGARPGRVQALGCLG